MKDLDNNYETSLKGLDWQNWLEKTAAITDEDGYTEPLGPDHAAVFVEERPILLVTFETHQRIARLSDLGHPFGWDLVKALHWSHLCLLGNGDTWFRDRHVYGYFDRLIDDGFFDDFDQVVFYGAGACGYAAAAFSVAAPAARVLVLQPQATLDPRIAEWDRRFPHMRRISFSDRFGYAPDMTDIAREVFLLYNPDIIEDAMHAALFNRANVTRFAMRHMGDDLEHDLRRLNILMRLIARLGAGKLDRHSLSRLYRTRRDDPAYQFNLLRRTTSANRPYLTMKLAEHILKRHETPRFRKAYDLARQQLGLTAAPSCDPAI